MSTIKRAVGAIFLVVFIFLVIGHSSPSHAQLSADSMLQPIAPADIPDDAAFYMLSDYLASNDGQGGSLGAPWPFLAGTNLVVYSLSGNSFIVDDTGGSFTNDAQALSAMASLLQPSDTFSANLFGGVAMTMSADDLNPNDSGGGDTNFSGYSSGYSSPVLDTNSLWLEITNVFDGTAYLNLHNATDQVYAIWGTTNLSGSFDVESELWPTNPVVMPFTELTSGRQNLFLFAEDWTGVTENGNTVPDGWLWKYFDTTDLSDTSLDGQGHTLLYDYQNNIIPFGILQQPMTQEVLARDTVTFTVSAIGPSPTYQWTLNGENIPGATGSSYTILGAQGGDQGFYAVTVSSGNNSITSSSAELIVDTGTGDLFQMWLIGQRQDYHFKDGITYYIANPVQLYGHTVFEGGTVVKIDWRYGNGGSLAIMGSLECDGKPYNPVIITSVDDDSPGEPLGASQVDGPPEAFAGTLPYLDLSGSSSSQISNMRIGYADVAVTTPAVSKQLDVWDCQFLKCNSAIGNQLNQDGGITGLHNVLIAGCGNAIQAGASAISINGEQVTADVAQFWSGPTTPSSITLKNSLITGTLGAANQISSESVAVNVPGSAFQPVNAGNYYLPAGSSFHNAGGTDISPQFLTEFTNKTTYAPVSIPLALTVNGELTFSPQAHRYAGGAPDMGYYYDPLDYTIADLTSFGSITILPGTAIGLRTDYLDATNVTEFGFYLREGSGIVSHGFPDKPNTFADVQLVQEQFENPCAASFVPAYFPIDQSSSPPSVDFRFCKFYAGSSLFHYHVWSGFDDRFQVQSSPDSAVFWTMQDCSFHGGGVDLGAADDGNFYGTCAVLWTNNVFDHTTVCLNPDWNLDFEYEMNVDMAFQAHNNLFRDNPWFCLIPIPASAGNWTFRDNLFDNTEFTELGIPPAPVDTDYNAYWPLPQSEIFFALDTSEMNTLGTHDQTLTSAPPYQAGPYGDFYLPDNTTLYGAGSDTATNLGLYHYTTRLDQVKEGEDSDKQNLGLQNVNVGVHYIATANSTSTTPRDTDGDGIPDYVENWHGDGNYQAHTDSETDWKNPMTDGVEADAYSVLYDDVDLDGDGLTGLFERLLGTNPLEPDNPLRLQTYQGVSEFADFPLGLSTLTNFNADIHAFINGDDTSFAEVVQDTNGNWHIQMDSASLPNGFYLLQPAISFSADFDTWKTTLGTPCLVSVSNALTIDPLTESFTDMLHIEAGLNVPADGYTVEIYDVDGNLLKTLSGTPSNNWISDSWDLTDTNGEIIVSGPLECDFFLNTQNPPRQFSPNSQVSAGPIRYRMNRHITGRAMTVAYAGYRFPNSADEMSQYVIDNLDADLGTSPSDYALLPINYNDPYSDDPFEWIISTNFSTTAILTNALVNSTCGNFYWQGHGGPIMIGPATNSGLRSSDVARILGNQGYQGSNTFFNNHPFRLVILDGCKTASWDWAKAWGIPFFDESTKARYQAYGLDTCAFVGWTKDTVQAPSNAGGNAYGACLNQLFASWYAGVPLKQCLNAYTQAYKDPANKPYLTAFDSWRISGCSDLTTFDR